MLNLTNVSLSRCSTTDSSPATGSGVTRTKQLRCFHRSLRLPGELNSITDTCRERANVVAKLIQTRQREIAASSDPANSDPDTGHLLDDTLSSSRCTTGDSLDNVEVPSCSSSSPETSTSPDQALAAVPARTGPASAPVNTKTHQPANQHNPVTMNYLAEAHKGAPSDHAIETGPALIIDPVMYGTSPLELSNTRRS